jgi:hypothetical protein
MIFVKISLKTIMIIVLFFCHFVLSMYNNVIFIIPHSYLSVPDSVRFGRYLKNSSCLCSCCVFLEGERTGEMGSGVLGARLRLRRSERGWSSTDSESDRGVGVGGLFRFWCLIGGSFRSSRCEKFSV